MSQLEFDEMLDKGLAEELQSTNMHDYKVGRGHIGQAGVRKRSYLWIHGFIGW